MKRWRPRSIVAFVLVLAIVSAVAAMTGCTSGSGTDDSKALEGKFWKVTELTAPSGTVPVIGVEITAEFASGKMSGTGGVNRYSTTYTTASGNKMTIAQPAATLIAGSPAAMAQEQAFFSALSKTAKYEVTANSLTLQDSQGGALVKFIAVEPRTLTNTEWDATSYNNGREALVSLAATSSITAKFGTDGSLSGNATINEYHTTYTTPSAGKMTISGAIVSTKMAGPAELMTQEDAYLAALPKTATYTIEGDQLWLRDSTGAAMAVYVAK